MADRLRREMKEKEMIPEVQTRFRKRRGVVDYLYILNYVVERQVEKGKKVMAAFVDLMAAFDSMNRGLIGRCLEDRGVSKRLRER